MKIKTIVTAAIFATTDVLHKISQVLVVVNVVIDAVVENSLIKVNLVDQVPFC